MKRAVIIILAVIGLKSSQAQQISMKQDTVVSIAQDKYQVSTNRFRDNFFINVAAGGQLYFGDHDRQMKLAERLVPNFGLNVGKWFTPDLGVRIGINGYKMKGATQAEHLSTGQVYNGKPWEGYWLYHQEFDYFHLHGDILFNLSNAFTGYKEKRFYSISPYVGLGWMVTNNRSSQKELSANLGIYNSFRLSNALDLTFDVRGAMVNDRFDGEIGRRRQEGTLSALVGFSYKFKQRGWDRPQSTVISYSEELLNALREKVRRLSEDNVALKRQLSAASTNSITQIKVEEKILAAPILITFPINKSTLSNEVRVNLGFFAKIIKSGNNNVVYTVTGYADKGTGPKAFNERLSHERAKAVYNLLVEEFDVNPKQLEIMYNGGVDNMFYDDPRLSRAVITIAK